MQVILCDFVCKDVDCVCILSILVAPIKRNNLRLTTENEPKRWEQRLPIDNRKREMNDTLGKQSGICQGLSPEPLPGGGHEETSHVAPWKACVGSALRLRVTSTRSHLLLYQHTTKHLKSEKR